ncbi:MAG: tetratricopeptide repeat protein [Proteobacteria bacterium]|nr:tetratricopeptide repeat protein [Pseudomonadota bacterium]
MTGKTSNDTFVSADVEKQLKNVDDHGKVIDPVRQQSAVRDNWVMARKSFFQRKYDLSEKSYQNVIDSTTDNHDAYGELGNVYFNQGKKQQAASAYFEAASILVRKGQVSRARTLVGLLRQLDSAKASELQALIDSTVS